MTLLKICQDAASEAGVIRPTSIIGSTSTLELKMRRAASRAGLGLAAAANWKALSKERTFTAIAGGTQTGLLPADFDRFEPETFWDRTNLQPLIECESPVEWAGLNAGNYAGTVRRFIRRGLDVSVIPAFSGGESLAFEYVSKNWCQSSGGTPQSDWAADTDTGILDEELLTLGTIFNYLTAEGLPAAVTQADFSARMAMLLRNEKSAARLMVTGDIFGGHYRFQGGPRYNTDNIDNGWV